MGKARGRPKQRPAPRPGDATTSDRGRKGAHGQTNERLGRAPTRRSQRQRGPRQGAARANVARRGGIASIETASGGRRGPGVPEAGVFQAIEVPEP
jgi:hypothetical protein